MPPHCFQRPCPFDLVGSGADLGHVPNHDDQPAAASEYLPVGQKTALAITLMVETAEVNCSVRAGVADIGRLQIGPPVGCMSGALAVDGQVLHPTLHTS